MQRHAIDARLDQLARALLLHPLRRDANAGARRGVARVDEQALRRLGILQLHPPGVRKIVLAWIVDRNRHDFVARCELTERVLPLYGPEVREDDHDGAVSQQLRRIAQRPAEVRAPAAGSERHEVADDSERVGAALRGSHHIFRSVGEEQRPDAVVVSRGGERQHGGDLHRQPRFGVGAAKVQRTGLIHDEEERELALFHERFDEGMTHSRRDIPVDCPEVIALLVGADFRELDPLAAEDRPVFAREQGADEVTSP